MVGAVIGLPATGVVEGVGALCDEELAGAGGGRLDCARFVVPCRVSNSAATATRIATPAARAIQRHGQRGRPAGTTSSGVVGTGAGRLASVGAATIGGVGSV